MFNINNYLRCKKCGEYNPEEKYTRYNVINNELPYRNNLTGEWLTYDEMSEKEDRFSSICRNCGAEGDDDFVFEDSKYRFNYIDMDYYDYTELTLCSRHFFKCSCGEVQIEKTGCMDILSEKQHTFKCKNCNKEYNREEFSSGIKYLTPSEIENDEEVKEAFNSFNRSMMTSCDSDCYLEWDDECSDWKYIDTESFFNKETGFIDYRRVDGKPLSI